MAVKNISGVAVVRDGKLLLLHKIKRDHFEFPGGKIDEGENPVMAAIREAKEEADLDVFVLKSFGPYDFSFKGKRVFSYVFLCDLLNEPRILEEDVFSGFRWISLEELEGFKLAPNVSLFVKDYLKSLK